jgi:NAD(P) transhydrogenase
VPGIYAVGDVAGFPGLASVAMEQGRRAVCHAFARAMGAARHALPYGIYTIPEISFVGPTERELTEAGVPYEVGIAYYREIARGQIRGDQAGRLKLLFHRGDGRVLGVHVIGEGAAELVHIGQTVMNFGGTIDYFVDNVFNYPTLAECYKVAALCGINRMATWEPGPALV